MPTANHRHPLLRCPECGELFERTHHRKMFCTPTHQKAYNNRQLIRGQELTTLVQAWRGARSSKDPAVKAIGKDAFTLLCRLADRHNADDKERANVSAVAVVMRRQAYGFGA